MDLLKYVMLNIIWHYMKFLAELNNQHSAILKKRQIASSYFHMGKIINTYWFEEGSTCKIGASLKDLH